MTDLERGPSRLNLFLAFTPFQLLMVDTLIKNQTLGNLPSVVINTSKQEFVNDSATVIHFHAARHSAWEQFKIYRQTISELQKMIDDSRLASVNCPHPHQILSNFLVFNEGDYQLNIYEDGLANYVAANNVGRLKRMSRVKALVAPMLGCRYHDYDGHITGIEDRIMDNGFFLDVERVFMPHRFRRLHQISLAPSLPTCDKKHSGIALVLDQDIESIFDKATAGQLREKLIAFLRSSPLQIHVKPHPAQSLMQSRDYFPTSFELVLDGRPAELVAIDMRPECVVGFTSSALKNIKNALPDCQCYSLAAHEEDELRGANLVEFFTTSGVHVL